MSKIRKKDLFINRYGELNYLYYFILKIVHFREKLFKIFFFRPPENSRNDKFEN